MVLAPEKKKLLRCPEKALSHRAHQRVWEVGEGSAAGEPASQGHVAVTSRPTQKWHNSKPGTERKPEVLPPTLRQLTQTPSAQSLVTTAAKIGYREPAASSPPQSCHHHLPRLCCSPSFSQRGPSTTINSATPGSAQTSGQWREKGKS